jgi:predicted permease
MVGPDRAAASVGDLEEELMARQTGRSPVRLVRLWWLRQAATITGTAAATGGSRACRTWGYVIRDAVRGLTSAPAVTMGATVILTAGIAAATVTFSVVDHVVLRHLPYPDDDQLVSVTGKSPTSTLPLVAPQDYFAWRDATPALAHLAAWQDTVSEIRIDDQLEQVPSLTTTATLFEVLRIAPVIGSPFGAEHEVRDAAGVVLISESLWRMRFGAAPDVVGRMLTVNGQPHRILGVIQTGFEFPPGAMQPTAIWLPYRPRATDFTYAGEPGRGHSLVVTGRLREGATIEQARAQVESVTAALAAEYPMFYRDWKAVTAPFREALVGPARGWMLLVLWAVALLVVVACVNVANLLLARSALRMRDFAVRAALGATSGQLVKALLVESLMLSLLASVASVLIASWALDLVKAVLPAGLPHATRIAIDMRVLAAMLGAAIATGLLFGIVPAWQASRADVTSILKSGGTTVVAGRPRWRSALLVAQMAVVVMLLVTTSLLVASFVRIMRADLGFNRTNLASMSVRLPLSSLPPVERSVRQREFYPQAADALRQVPGVTHVAMMAGGGLPLSGSRSSTRVSLPDAPETMLLTAEQRRVSPDYFETAGIRILEGRTFAGAEEEKGSVIIDELAARRLFGERAALGRRVRLAGGGERVVVGVTANVRLTGPEGEQLAQVYYPWNLAGGQSGEPLLVVRTARDAGDIAPLLRAAIAPLLPAGAPPPSIRIVADQYRQLTAGRRFNAGLMLVFGALALVIGAAGIYSVMASVVAQQRREIGIRTALGATRSRIAVLVLSEAGRHVAIGLAIGLAAAWAVSGMFSSLVFGVTPTEPILYFVVAVVLAGVGLAAAWMPARRASRVDPIAALRE